MKDLFADRPSFWLLQSIKETLSAWWFEEFHKEDDETVLTKSIEGAIDDVDEAQQLDRDWE